MRERCLGGVPFCFLASFSSGVARGDGVPVRRSSCMAAARLLRDLRGDCVPVGYKHGAGGRGASPPRDFGTVRTPSTRPGAGATRNFESWRQQDEAEEKFEGERKEAAEANAMSALESKTLDSKIEMDILDALDEIKAYNERHERVDRAELGSAQKPADEMSAKERDEMAAFKRAQAARAVDAKPPPLQGSSSDEAVPAPPPALAAPEPARPPSPPAPVVLKRRLADAPPPVEKKPKLGGLVAYSSSSSEGDGSS